ncbi:transglutaminase family protein [Arthrobacter sp. NPDC055138]
MNGASNAPQPDRQPTRARRRAADGKNDAGLPAARRRRPQTAGGLAVWLPRPGRQLAIDAAVLVLLLGLGLAGFHHVFGGNGRYLTAGVGGIVVGLLLSLASARYRLGLLSTATAGLGAYLLFGSAFAAPAAAIGGVLPSLESLRTLLTGFVFAWKDILTVAPPVGVTGGMLVVPYLGALASALLAGTLAWRVRRPYWPLLPVLAFFLLGIAFGTDVPALPVLRGVLLVAVSAAWLAWDRHLARGDASAGVAASPALADPAAHRAGLRRRLGLGAGMLTGAVVLTALAGPALTARGDREVLRDVVVPPVNLYDYPSPLMDFRGYVKDRPDETLFTVAGLPEGQRVRLAALDTFDGTVYNVNPESGGNFTPVGDAGSLGPVSGDNARLDIRIEDYNGVWLPAGGRINGMAFDGDRAGELGGSLFYNDESKTALTTRYLRAGDGYSVETTFPGRWEDAQLAQYDFASVRLPEPVRVPDIIAAKANEFVGEATAPIEQVRQLERNLHENGFFSNGKEDEARSLSGHHAGRMIQLLDAEQMIGDDEQYAVAMALMSRHLGIPARVVMGFYPDPQDGRSGSGPVQIKGEDVHAWVEVAFEHAGWVAFDPTPDEDNEPTPPQQEPKSTPKPQVLQPPPPPQEPAELPPDTAPEPQDAEQQDKSFWDQWGWLFAAAGLAAVPLAVLLAPLLLIAWLKLRRRKRRASEGLPSERVGGGWREVISLATDMGARAAANATRREHASALAEQFPTTAAGTTLLARRADAAIFGAAEPTEVQVQQYWDRVDQSLAEMKGSLGFWQRQRAKYSPRSLVADARRRLAQRGRAPAAARIRTVDSQAGRSEQGGSSTWQQD